MSPQLFFFTEYLLYIDRGSVKKSKSSDVFKVWNSVSISHIHKRVGGKVRQLNIFYFQNSVRPLI